MFHKQLSSMKKTEFDSICQKRKHHTHFYSLYKYFISLA
jgi:hypothetical protein